jgi:hypothetical protein
MGEKHDAKRSIAQARSRMSVIAEELSRRATPEYVRERAHERVDDFKLRARIRAQERTAQMKDKILENPWALGLLGGAVGALAGKFIGDRARKRYEDREYGPRIGYGADYGYDYDDESERYGLDEGLPYSAEVATGGRIITDDALYGLEGSAEVRERTHYPSPEAERSEYRERLEAATAHAAESKDNLKQKALDAKENLQHKAHDATQSLKHKAADARDNLRNRGDELKAKMSSGDGPNLRERASNLRQRAPSAGELRHRMHHSAEDHMALWGLGAMAAGLLFGLAMPVSRKEHELLGPAKAKGLDQARNLGEQAMDRAKGLEHKVRDTIKSEIGLGGGSSSGRSDEARSEPGGQQAEFGEVRGTYTASDEGQQFTPITDPDVTRH